MLQEISLQRLFSTFANGMPGMGLMLQRLVTGAALMFGVALDLHARSQAASAGLTVIDAGAGFLVVIGLWTPAAGAIVAGRELCAMVSRDGNPWLQLVLATLGATLAMIGPGAWSIDARLFGRRQIKRSN